MKKSNIKIITNGNFPYGSASANYLKYFAFLLGLSILLEFIQNDFHLNKVIIQEILVGITTFSTTYFIVFILFLTIGFLQNKNWKRYWIISLPFFSTDLCLLLFLISIIMIK